MVIFSNDPDLKGMFALNSFSGRAVLTRSPPPTEGIVAPGPYPRTCEEADRSLCLAYLQRLYASQFKMETVNAAMSGVAVACNFHPVRDYIDGLCWDGVPRVAHWLSDAFGAALDQYHHAIGVKFLCAGVRRVRKPGCKFDTILVLEGPQNIGKSRACRALFGDDWFSDNLPADMSGRDISDSLQGLWGIEFAEIEHLLRAEPETIKAFLSRQIDRFRPAYARMPIERPRQCIFVGTTNSDDYARDSTGNRRLWPVRCDFADADWVAKNRDQLWAEAAVLEPTAKLWIEEESVQTESLAQQAARHDEDPWEDGILAYLVSRCGSSVTVSEIMADHLHLSKDKQDKRGQMRIAKILRHAGWHRNQGGNLGRRWLSKK
jgi:putative DNA primase/helicase